MFQGRKLIIATKHQKENVIAPLLEEAFGVHCFVDERFDTDTLGTFTGEIERELDPVATLRKKCLLAMELNNCNLGVASEGSFGPHPSLLFVGSDDEFLIFIDKENDLEIIARELSLETNFNGKQIESESELLEFAQAAKFPSHALILRRSKNDYNEIIKGITDTEQLKEAFKNLFKKYDSVYVETDMRALYNPMRMQVIETAAKKLVDQINLVCPQCNKPSFGITDAKRGLKCSLCSSPTNSTISHIYVCKHCQFTKEEMYPNQKTREDPTYCDYCNP
jgi:hypothetical protein